MNKTENIMLIDEQLDNTMKMARIVVENGEMTKDEMSKYIADKANELFIKIFDASDNQFAMMLLGDIVGKLPEIMEKWGGDDEV